MILTALRQPERGDGQAMVPVNLSWGVHTHLSASRSTRMVGSPQHLLRVLFTRRRSGQSEGESGYSVAKSRTEAGCRDAETDPAPGLGPRHACRSASSCTLAHEIAIDRLRMMPTSEQSHQREAGRARLSGVFRRGELLRALSSHQNKFHLAHMQPRMPITGTYARSGIINVEAKAGFSRLFVMYRNTQRVIFAAARPLAPRS
jgi:hypothetical protein